MAVPSCVTYVKLTGVGDGAERSRNSVLRPRVPFQRRDVVDDESRCYRRRLAIVSDAGVVPRVTVPVVPVIPTVNVWSGSEVVSPLINTLSGFAVSSGFKVERPGHRLKSWPGPATRSRCHPSSRNSP